MAAQNRRPLVAVVGRGDIPAGHSLWDLAHAIGRGIVDAGCRLATGGLGGVMAAASQGARSSEGYREGDVVGVLPGRNPDEANEYVDIALATGLGDGRNLVLANSDAVIAVGGGAGTLLELAAAWKGRALIIALAVEGWSGELAGRRIDDRRPAPILSAQTPVEALDPGQPAFSQPGQYAAAGGRRSDEAGNGLAGVHLPKSGMAWSGLGRSVRRRP